MRVFLDANVLFTALHNPNGKAALVIELGARGLWDLYSSSWAVKEARRNLARKVPRAIEGLATMLNDIRLVEHQSGLEFPAELADKDRPIFQAALACRATHLLTGDMKDFGPFMNRPDETFGVHIQTVAEFLNRRGKGEHDLG